MLTATLTPPVGVFTPAADVAEKPEIHLPLHTLQGEARVWANRLLSVFRGRQLDGVEWSLKFSVAGLVGNRFLLGIKRENWRQLDMASLPTTLAIPPALWMRVLQDMDVARAMFFAYEPDADAGTYRIYLEFTPGAQALREQGVLPLGCGYKWNPRTGQVSATTTYRMRFLENRDAFDRHVTPYLNALVNPVLRQFARKLIVQASSQANPSDFMFLEVDESDSRRDSFTLTFRGADIPLCRHIPDLLRLAGSFALPENEVLGFLVPDDPRSICSVAAGVARDGHEFLTLYYD